MNKKTSFSSTLQNKPDRPKPTKLLSGRTEFSQMNPDQAPSSYQSEGIFKILHGI